MERVRSANSFDEAWIGGAPFLARPLPDLLPERAVLLTGPCGSSSASVSSLAAATLALLTAARSRAHARWLLLPLAFSPSLLDVAASGLHVRRIRAADGLSQLGVAIAACLCVARVARRPIPLAAAVAFGGVLASWSWGGGVMVWPVFAIALFDAPIRAFGAWAIFRRGARRASRSTPGSLRAASGPRPRTSPGRRGLGPSSMSSAGRSSTGSATPTPTSCVAGSWAPPALLALAVLLAILRGSAACTSVPLFLVAWASSSPLRSRSFALASRPGTRRRWPSSGPGSLMLFAGAPPLPRASRHPRRSPLLALRVQLTWEDKSFYLPRGLRSRPRVSGSGERRRLPATIASFSGGPRRPSAG